MKSKRILALCLSLVTLLAFAGCTQQGGQEPSLTTTSAAATTTAAPTTAAPAQRYDIRIGMLTGATGVGAAYLMEENEKGTSANNYTFSLAAAPTDLVGQLTSGALDMIAVPTNLAASLYAKTQGNIRIVALNTLGVLNLLENGDTIHSVADLKGKTVYAFGQGANPEYVLNYILEKNGLKPGTDVEIVFKDNAELTTLMATGQAKIAMLPVPASTTVLTKNADVRFALDITDEWDKVKEDDSVLTMGCVVTTAKYAEEHADAISGFLNEYAASIDYTNANPKDAAALVEKFAIVPSAAIAEKAIPDCNLVCITGDAIQPAVEGYFNVLFKADPTSVGGAVPDAGIYFK